MTFEKDILNLPFQAKENLRLIQYSLSGGEKMYCQIDENNLRQDKFALLDKYGQPEAVGTFKDDMLDGQFSEFFPSGELRASSFFHKNTRVGQYMEFYENGQLAVDGELNAQGQKTGLWTLYDEDGCIKAKSSYKNDMLHGESLIYEDDCLVEKRQYVHNRREGVQIEYYPSGVMKCQCVYRDDKLNGPNIDYYENGQKMLVNRYENGDPVGAYTYYYEENGWYEKGTLDKDGFMDGVITFYGHDDNPREEHTYKHGVLDGRTTYFWPDGSKKWSLLYKDGKSLDYGSFLYGPNELFAYKAGKGYEQVWPPKTPLLLTAKKDKQR